MRARHRAFRIGCCGLDDRTYPASLIRRIDQLKRLPAPRLAIDERGCMPRLRGCRLTRCLDRAQLRAIREVHAPRVHAIATVNAWRVDDAWMRHLGVPIDLLDRI